MDVATGKSVGDTVYEALAERLRRAIQMGEYAPGSLIGSEYGLAREESISRMTVRRASELLVNEGLVERRPGKGLYVRADCSPGGSSRPMQIQVVFGNLFWESSLQISRGVQAIAKTHGLQVQLYDAHGDVDLDLEMVRQLPGSPAKGAIILSLHNAAMNECVYQLKAEGFPFVLVDQRLHDIDVPSVLADNWSGGHQAGRELLQLGHRRIGFIGDLVAATVRDRLSGLRDAVNDAGVAFDRSLVVDIAHGLDRLGDWSAVVEEATRELMNRPSPPTAIFFSCDGVARPACRALRKLGLSIPSDVSVIGFDDDPLAEWLPTPLTTIRQPFHEMGQAALEVLYKQIADSGATVEHCVLPVELVRRGSTAAAKHV